MLPARYFLQQAGVARSMASPRGGDSPYQGESPHMGKAFSLKTKRPPGNFPGGRTLFYLR